MDVHINNPKRSLLREIEFRADMALPRRASEITDILEVVGAGKPPKIAISPKLAIASFIIHYLGWQAVRRRHMRESRLNLTRV